MDLDSGIFIPCEPGDERECLTALHEDALKESKHSISVENDKTHGGLRLIFNDPSKARDILEMRCVSRFPVYPLSTSLVVHTDQNKFADDFHQLLRDAMKDIGPVVDVYRIPFFEKSTDLTDFFTNNWKVVLGVPEKDGLAPFQKAGLPDNMTLKLPGFQTEFRVTFGCSKCKGEHTAWNCPSKSPVKTETQSSRIDSVAATRGEEPTTPTSSATGSEFRIRDRREDAKPPVKRHRSFDTDSMALKIGEEQVRNTFGDQLKSPIKKVPKTEVGNGIPRVDTLLQEKIRMLSHHTPALNPGTSAESDGEVLIVDELSSNSRKLPLMRDYGFSIRSSIEEPAQVSTSSLPDGFGDLKSELPSADDNSDSNLDPPSGIWTPASFTPSKIPKPRQSATPDFSVHIPEPIREIIQQTPGVLDVVKLEAFFNNVKKKSSPCMVAKQYTDDVNGLKDQLQNIKEKFYYAPVMRSVKEKQFMKWFEPMLDRFDRKPCVKPRKRTVPNTSQQMQG